MWTLDGGYMLLLIILGLCLGSFLNVIIYRLPIILQTNWRTECENFLKGNSENILSSKFTLSKPRSFCPHCKKALKFFDNIPLISYLILKGQCRFCTTSISYQYPLVEIIASAIAVFLGFQFGFSLHTIAALIFCYTLFVLTLIDLKHQLLPDIITQPLLWLGLIFNLQGMFAPLPQAVLGALLGYGSLWTFSKIFYFLTKREGMAHGDMKLFAAIGAWLGWQMLPQVMLFASLAGSLLGSLWLYTLKRSHSTPIPFGPFLAFFGVVALLWGSQINQYFF
jgi:leader peptidase (prepilin peptidase)/N-methyltransferase